MNSSPDPGSVFTIDAGKLKTIMTDWGNVSAITFLLFSANEICTHNQHVDQVSAFYGPGVWGAWILMATTVVVTQEVCGPFPAIGSNAIASWKRKKHADELPRAKEGGRQELRMSANALVVAAYPVIASFDCVYQSSQGLHSAQFNAAYSVVCAGHIFFVAVYISLYHTKLSSRSLIWTVLAWPCYTASASAATLRSASRDMNGWYLVVLFLRMLLDFCSPSFVCNLSRAVPRGPSQSFTCSVCSQALVPTHMTIIAITLFVASRPGFEEDCKFICEVRRIVPTIPITGQNLGDKYQTIALAAGAIIAARSFYRWYQQR